MTVGGRPGMTVGGRPDMDSIRALTRPNPFILNLLKDGRIRAGRPQLVLY